MSTSSGDEKEQREGRKGRKGEVMDLEILGCVQISTEVWTKILQTL